MSQLKNNEIVRRLVLQHISKKPSSLVSDICDDIGSDVTFTLEENDVRAALKWLTRNGYIETEQSIGGSGRFAACERKVLKRF